MKSKAGWVLAGLALAACGSLAVLWTPSESLPPRRVEDRAPAGRTTPAAKSLKIEPEWLDFEEVRLGQKKTLSLRAENPGSAPVKVLKVIFTCDCLKGPAGAVSIPPGESVEIPITFTGMPDRGTLNTLASVITDESGACRYEVGVRGRVRLEFVLDPETIDLGKIAVGATPGSKTTLRRRNGAPFTIRQIKSPRSDLTLTWKPTEEGKLTSYDILVSVQGGRAGHWSETVAVVTDQTQDPSPVFTVTANVEGPVTVHPSVVPSKLTGDPPQPTFDFVLKHHAGSGIRVTGIKDSRDSEVDFSATPGPSELRVQVRIRKPSASPNPHGEFEVSLEGVPDPLHVPYRMEHPDGKQPGNP